MADGVDAGLALRIWRLNLFAQQRDAAALAIDFQHLHTYHVSHSDQVVRILDEAVVELRDVNQAILVHTDVHKGPKPGDVGHDPLHDHSRLHVVEFVNVVGEYGRLEFAAWIACGLGQLGQDVLHGGQAHTLVDELGGVQLGRQTWACPPIA